MMRALLYGDVETFVDNKFYVNAEQFIHQQTLGAIFIAQCLCLWLK